MIDDFCISIFIPSIGEKVQFKQLTNKYYKNILKFIQNNDEDNLNEYFEYMIDNLCVRRNMTFNRIDKFIIILTIYIVCINDTITVKNICKETNKAYKNKIELFEILDKMSDAALYDNSIVKIDPNTKLKLGFPSGLRYDGSGKTIADCVKHIIVNGKEFNLTEMTEEERNNIFSFLPLHCFSKIKSYIKTAENEMDNIVYMKIKSPFVDEPAERYTFNVFDNTMFDFIWFIFGCGLKDYYDLMYIAFTKLNISESFAENHLTPAELLLYLKNYEGQLEAQAQRKSSKKPPQANYNIDSAAPKQVDLGLNFD